MENNEENGSEQQAPIAPIHTAPWFHVGAHFFAQNFVFISVRREKFEAKCLFCPQQYPYAGPRSYGRLLTHQLLHTEEMEARAQEENENNLVRSISIDLVPLESVQIMGLQIMFKVPKVSQGYFKVLIERNYIEIKNLFKMEMASVSYLSLILANWQSESKVDIVVVYIHNQRRKYVYLATIELGANLAQLLPAVLNDWNIDREKVVAVVTKNVPRLKQICVELQFLGLPCALEVFTQILKEWFKRNPSIKGNLNKYKNICIALEPSENARIVLTANRDQLDDNQDVTSLITNLHLLTSVASLQNDVSGPKNPTAECIMTMDFGVIGDYIKIFQLLVKIWENLVTTSKQALSVIGLFLCEIKTCETETCQSIIESLKTIVNETFGLLSSNALELCHQAIYLDTRYKSKYFSAQYKASTQISFINLLKSLARTGGQPFLPPPNWSLLEDTSACPFVNALVQYERMSDMANQEIEFQIGKLNLGNMSAYFRNLQERVHCVPACADLVELNFHREKKLIDREYAKKILFMHFWFVNNLE